MKKNPVKRSPAALAAALQDHFSGVWKLLSETTVFLSRIPEFGLYEKQLRSWRLALQTEKNNPDTVRRVREEIIALRKELRLAGCDLSLGGHNLIFEGFRNDACLGEGFRRLVLFIGEGELYYLTGEENHVTLADYLERRLWTGNFRGQIRGKHYLWYRRRGKDLIISGADTETKEDFERLKAMAQANSLFFLGGLKGLS